MTNGNPEIKMTIKDLEDLLTEQKKVVSEYITRNLTVYMWYEDTSKDITKMKEEIRQEVMKSGLPNDIAVLKKYL